MIKKTVRVLLLAVIFLSIYAGKPFLVTSGQTNGQLNSVQHDYLSSIDTDYPVSDSLILHNQTRSDYLSLIKELPDPFLRTNGSRVTTMVQWMAHRADLKEKIQHYEYGHLAPPSSVKVVSISSDSIIEKGSDRFRKRTVNLQTGPDGAILFSLILFIPDNLKGPLPVIVDGDLCWGSLLTVKRLKPEGVISIMKRGYIIAEFDRTKFAPDKNVRNSGVYTMYNDYDWGALAAWAWGYHRVIDFLLMQNYVDKEKICVTGWSRGGKTALLAGALDERIALVAPNCSGTSGSGPLRYIDVNGETLDGIATNFPHWFNSEFQNFKGKNRDKIPFDQHTLIALVAPRAYLSTNGLKDTHANPKGTAQAHQAAKEVFTALGSESKMGIFFNNTGHDHNIDKWIALIDFADMIFYGKKAAYDYKFIPFPNLEKAYSWSRPF